MTSPLNVKFRLRGVTRSIQERRETSLKVVPGCVIEKMLSVVTANTLFGAII